VTSPAPATVSGFAELTLEVRDRPAMERFYRDVVGLELLAQEDDRTWMAAGDQARLGLWLPGEKEFGDEGGSHVHYAYSATPEQLDALAARLAGQGVEHRGPVEHEGGDRSLYFEDPEGNVVEVWDIFGRGRNVASLAQVKD
jgi:catechol-2,3-dioxygenase